MFTLNLLIALLFKIMAISGNLLLYIVARLKEPTLFNLAYICKNYCFYLWNDKIWFDAQIYSTILHVELQWKEKWKLAISLK